MNRTPPDISRLLRALQDYDVRFVLAGSVAAQAWGAEIEAPGDLDIVPATEEIDLRRLAAALVAMDAQPFPVTGEWKSVADGFEWHEFETGDPRRVATPPLPDPLNPKTYDSLFTTRYGALDIVPAVSGTYLDLFPRSTRLTVHGVPEVQVISIPDLLEHLTVPRRVKDVARVAHLRKQQRESLP